MILVTGTTGQLGGVASEFRRGGIFFNNPRSGGVVSEFRRGENFFNNPRSGDVAHKFKRGGIFFARNSGTASIFAIDSKTQKKSGEHAK